MVRLQAFQDEEGHFISLTWIGGYPCYYLDSDNNVLCPDCANKKGMSTEVVAGDVYEEGPVMYCDDCGAAIESAYGDPDEENG